MIKYFYVYLMTNSNNTVIYTGVTNDLKKRIFQRKSKTIKGFTEKYNVTKLAYYEIFDGSYEVISREKQIKAGSRKKENRLDLLRKDFRSEMFRFSSEAKQKF